MTESESSAAAPPAESPTAEKNSIGVLLRGTRALSPDVSIFAVARLMLADEHSGLLSLPIVRDGRPIGSISRYELMRVFLTPYGRDLYGRRPIETLANRNAVVLAADTPIEEAARLIAERIPSPITEDFILIDTYGHYLGTGVVLDVLRSMDKRLAERGHELERAYARAKSSQLQLVQTEKMASLGQMVAGLVHEINTPLAYVRNNVELTRSALNDAADLVSAYESATKMLFDDSADVPDDQESRMDRLSQLRVTMDSTALADTAALLDDTVHGIEQISTLVGDLKDFSRLDQAGTERADINQLVDSALRIVQHVMRKRHIEIVRHVGEVPLIECAPAQINQVLLNLLSNAAQAIDHDHGRIAVRTQTLGPRVMVVVEDNGKGIAEADLARIFDPFFTTKPIGQGTGLGLAITHQIVQQHKGVIRATSKPGIGTRFMLALPLEAIRKGT